VWRSRTSSSTATSSPRGGRCSGCRVTNMDPGSSPTPTSSTRHGSRASPRPTRSSNSAGRVEAVRRNRVHAGGDAGHDAQPGEAVQVALMLQGQHLRQRPHADAVAWSAHRARAQRPGFSMRERVLTSDSSVKKPTLILGLERVWLIKKIK
jgi:hypothetical protein